MAILRITLDQKVEGSNPSSPATPLNCTRVTIRRLSDERSGQDVDSKMVRLEFFDEGMSLPTLVTPLGNGIYRLEETEFMAELNHHDVIEAEDLGLERLRFIRVAERSELLPRSGIFSKEFLDSAEMQSLLDWLGGRGGYWQREMGGCLLLSIPKDSETDFDARWSQVVDSLVGSDRL